MFENSALIEEDSVVGETSWAGTEGKLWLLSDVFTVTSKCPGLVDTTWTVTTSSEAVSVWSVIIRSYLSPPKRREDNVAHGDGAPVVTGAEWSRSAMKRAACARSSGLGSGIGGNSSSKCFYNSVH